jgi:hypothetical protein
VEVYILFASTYIDEQWFAFAVYSSREQVEERAKQEKDSRNYFEYYIEEHGVIKRL